MAQGEKAIDLRQLLYKSRALAAQNFLFIILAGFLAFTIVGSAVTRYYIKDQEAQVLGVSAARALNPQTTRYISIDKNGTRILPRSMTIKTGTTVVWKTAENKTYLVRGTGFSGKVSQAEYFSYTFSEPGTFTFKIDNNRNEGTIIVQ